MNKKGDCKIRDSISSHRGMIAGVFFLVVATLLTILTLNGMGIFGMFIAGLVLCCHKHMCGSTCHADECESESDATTSKSGVKKSTATAKK